MYLVVHLKTLDEFLLLVTILFFLTIFDFGLVVTVFIPFSSSDGGWLAYATSGLFNSTRYDPINFNLIILI